MDWHTIGSVIGYILGVGIILAVIGYMWSWVELPGKIDKAVEHGKQTSARGDRTTDSRAGSYAACQYCNARDRETLLYTEIGAWPEHERANPTIGAN